MNAQLPTGRRLVPDRAAISDFQLLVLHFTDIGNEAPVFRNLRDEIFLERQVCIDLAAAIYIENLFPGLRLAGTTKFKEATAKNVAQMGLGDLSSSLSPDSPDG